MYDHSNVTDAPTGAWISSVPSSNIGGDSITHEIKSQLYMLTGCVPGMSVVLMLLSLNDDGVLCLKIDVDLTDLDDDCNFLLA